MLNIFNDMLCKLKLEIYCQINKILITLIECPAIKKCSKKEVTIHFKNDGTSHRGHRLHNVTICTLYQFNCRRKLEYPEKRQSDI
jgi:hypothetical protein